MRAALLTAALALGFAAPLCAQEADVPAAAPAPPPAAGSIVLVTGPDKLLATLGTAPLDPEAELCLAPDEVALLASDRVTFELRGDGCFTAFVAERRAFGDEQFEIQNEALNNAHAEILAARESRDEAAIARAFEKYAAALKPVRLPFRTRTAALRGAPDSDVPPRPIIFRLASGSPSVLDRFPRGSIVQRTTSLCLKQGEQATIGGSHGQSVTYTGPGCLKRQAKPTAANIGGFTFG